MSDYLTRLGLGLSLIAVSALLAVVALAFLFAALFLGVAEHAGPPLAALVTGLAVAVVAVLLVLGARAVAAGAPRPARPAAADDAGALGARLSAEFGREFDVLMRENAWGLVGAALVAGVLVGISPRLRRSVWRLLQ